MKTALLLILASMPTFAQIVLGPRTPKGNWDFSGATVTGLGSGGIYCADATGSTTVYTCPTPTPVPISYVAGMLLALTPQTTNSGTTPTVNVAGLGAKNLKGSDGNNLAASALTGGTAYLFNYNGTSFIEVSAGGGSFPTNPLTPSGNATLTSLALDCVDKTVLYSDFSAVGSGTATVTIATPTAYWMWTDIWARETVTFAGTSMTTATVSIGLNGGSGTELLPAISLKQATNTQIGNVIGQASGSAIVGTFIITTGGGIWSGATAGTYEIRACGHKGR